MKRLILITAILVSLLYCKRLRDESNSDIFFSANGIKLKFENFEAYDSSAHIFYLKNPCEGLGSLSPSKFVFLDNGDTIYKGYVHPAYFNSMPADPIIQTDPFLTGNYALKIDWFFNTGEDVRNCDRIIRLLKKHSLLHPGLSGRIDSLNATDTSVVIRYSITNCDESPLLILNQDKMGAALFHYFTTGLTLKDKSLYNAFTNSIDIQTPDPWNSYKSEWLTLLEPGKSTSFVLSYHLGTRLLPGTYSAFFEFPGLTNQVPLDELVQSGNRIWLGNLRLSGSLTIK